MATGLTLESIAALYGLTNHLMSQAQCSQLVTVVILSAFVPTLIAQQFFKPEHRRVRQLRRRRLRRLCPPRGTVRTILRLSGTLTSSRPAP